MDLKEILTIHSHFPSLSDSEGSNAFISEIEEFLSSSSSFDFGGSHEMASTTDLTRQLAEDGGEDRRVDVVASPPTTQNNEEAKKVRPAVDYRKYQSPEKRAKRLKQDAERHRQRYKKESEEDRAKRLERDALRHRQRYEERKRRDNVVTPPA